MYRIRQEKIVKIILKSCQISSMDCGMRGMPMWNVITGTDFLLFMEAKDPFHTAKR